MRKQNQTISSLENDLKEAKANRVENDAINYYKEIADKCKEEVQSLKFKIQHLEKSLGSVVEDYEKQLVEKKYEWDLLFGKTELKQRQFKEMLLKDKDYEIKYKKQNDQIIGLEEQNRLMNEQLKEIYYNHSQNFEGFCDRCVKNLDSANELKKKFNSMLSRFQILTQYQKMEEKLKEKEKEIK